MADVELLKRETPRIKLSLKLTEDRLKLFLTAEPGVELKSLLTAQDKAEKENHTAPRITPVHREELLVLISESANLDLIEMGVVDDVAARLSKGEKVPDRRIARGRPPTVGINGKLVFLVKILDGSKAPQIDEKGFTDFREVHLFDNVAVGQEIARIYPPRKGKDGIDALGRRLDGILGKEAVVEFHETVQLRQPPRKESAYQSIFSLVEGYITLVESRVMVKEELLIKQDLDYHTGNIDFAGKVTIQGDVLRGFRIKASKGIEVQGAVRGATLITTDGDITIKGMAFGDEHSFLLSGASIQISTGQELRAAAKQHIVIGKEARDCVFKVFGAVFADKGRIIGGKILSPCGVQAKEIGSDREKETSIILCTDIETTPEYAEVSNLIQGHKHALELLELHLGPFAKHPERIQFLNPEQRSKMEQLHAKMQSVSLSIESLQAKKLELLSSGKQTKALRVNFLKLLHPAAKISVRDVVFSSQEVIKGPSSLEFIPESETFEIKELTPLNFELNSQSYTSTHPEDEPIKDSENE